MLPRNAFAFPNLILYCYNKDFQDLTTSPENKNSGELMRMVMLWGRGISDSSQFCNRSENISNGQAAETILHRDMPCMTPSTANPPHLLLPLHFKSVWPYG